MHQYKFHKSFSVTLNNQGAIALITVIILGAIMLIIGLSASHIGQTETIIAGQLDRGQHALTMASACAEEALFRLKQDDSYIGESLTIGDISCEVMVSGTGTTRSITSSAVSGNHTRTIEVLAEYRQNFDTNAETWSISAWQEINP